MNNKINFGHAVYITIKVVFTRSISIQPSWDSQELHMHGTLRSWSIYLESITLDFLGSITSKIYSKISVSSIQTIPISITNYKYLWITICFSLGLLIRNLFLESLISFISFIEVKGKNSKYKTTSLQHFPMVVNGGKAIIPLLCFLIS